MTETPSRRELLKYAGSAAVAGIYVDSAAAAPPARVQDPELVSQKNLDDLILKNIRDEPVTIEVTLTRADGDLTRTIRRSLGPHSRQSDALRIGGGVYAVTVAVEGGVTITDEWSVPVGFPGYLGFMIRAEPGGGIETLRREV